MEPATLRRIIERSLYGVIAVQLVTGILAFFGWFVPHFTEGILPDGFVDFFRQRSLEGSTAVHAIHYATGALLVLGVGAYGVLWYLGRIRPHFLDQGQETSTTAFWRWFLGLFSRDRAARLHFRDALLLPRMEYAGALAIAIVTFALLWIPGGIGKAALGLHRVNALYIGFLALWTGLVYAARRREPSPFPTAIVDGELRRSQA